MSESHIKSTKSEADSESELINKIIDNEALKEEFSSLEKTDDKKIETEEKTEEILENSQENEVELIGKIKEHFESLLDDSHKEKYSSEKNLSLENQGEINESKKEANNQDKVNKTPDTKEAILNKNSDTPKNEKSSVVKGTVSSIKATGGFFKKWFGKLNTGFLFAVGGIFGILSNVLNGQKKEEKKK